MIRPRTIAAVALTATALAPAVALADAELRGAPTLRTASGTTADLTFAVSEKLPRRDGGGIDANVRFSDQGVSSIASAGRHGKAYKYTSRVRSERKLRVGAKYTVRIVIDGQPTITRKVKLLESRR